MNKKNELFKSITLILLVIMSIILFARSWAREWNYNGGENDNLISKAASIIGFGGIFAEESDTPVGTDIVAPSSIIFTSGAMRVIANRGTDMYTGYYSDILSILLSLNNYTGTPSEVSDSDWYAAQKTQAIYLDYGVTYRSHVLESGIGVGIPDSIENVSSVVLTSNNNATNKLVIYMFDGQKNKYYKMLTSDSARKVKNLLLQAQGYENIPLAVELGFNTSPSEDVGQQVVINGNAIISLEDVRLPSLSYVPVENAFASLDKRSLNNLLSLFGMSKSSAKQYADSDGTTMYIDTYGTLRLYTGGIIEYTAASPQHGKILFSDTNDDLYSMVCSGYNQAYKVAGMYGMNKNMMLRVAADITGLSTDQDGSNVLNLDYSFNGRVILPSSNNIANHGVQLKINKTGGLIYYKQYLFNVEQSTASSTLSPILNAINNVYLFAENGEKIIYLNSISPGYKVENNEVRSTWCVKFKGSNKTFTIE